MNFLTPIYNQLNTDVENTAKKGTFYSLINYIVANENSFTIKKKDLHERFSLKRDFNSIIELLINSKVLTQDEDIYRLNIQAKEFITPYLQNILASSYKEKYNIANTELTDSNLDPNNISMLLDCRKQIYSS